MIFVIFHGSFGSPTSNWAPYLKRNLTKLGHTVYTPKFPVDDWDQLTKLGPKTKHTKENLDSWLAAWDKFTTVKGPSFNAEPVCFIGHSLAPVFILTLVQKYNLQLDSAIFVAPFLRDLHKNWQFLTVNRTFYVNNLKQKLNFPKIRKLIPASHVLYSDNDPYVEEKYALEFADKLSSQKILVRGAGHFGSSAGLTKFPQLLNLAKTRTS